MSFYKWITFAICILLVGIGFYTFQLEESSGISREYSSKTSPVIEVKSLNDRPLDLGTINTSNEKVTDEPSALFNDPAIKEAWGLKKTDAARAWSLSRGSKDIIVAIIDTGVDINHEDLKANLWRNPGETGIDDKGRDKATNGIDDDGNGFVDDVYGWNFVSNNNKLDDNHGHGCHIGCLIGAEAGNGKGIIGIAPQVSLMILKYYDPKHPNTDNLKNTIKAIEYAIKMGANIINYSGGGTEYSKEEFEAVKLAEQKGILFVAAAGNEKSNSDKNKFYPADYGLKNIISVTAIDTGTKILPSSNYGVETVDIAAPGDQMLSCLPNNTYGKMTGTSQATALVSGGAALIMAHKKITDPAEVKKYILSTGDVDTSLINRIRTSRKLNLFKALTIIDQNVTVSGLTESDMTSPKTLSNAANAANGTSATTSDDPNLKPENIGSFGRSLLKALKKVENEKPQNSNLPRLGNTQEQENGL